jgi:hypothetical protein
MEKFFYYLENDDPTTIIERLLKLLASIAVIIAVFVTLCFLVCYFLCGLFLLDGLYYIITGKTIVAKHL